MSSVKDAKPVTRSWPVRLIQATWKWLGNNSPHISSVGVIVQTLAVVIGVTLAVRQLRMLVASEAQASIRKTTAFWDESFTVLDSLHGLSGNYEDWSNDDVSSDVLSHPNRYNDDFTAAFDRSTPIFRNLEFCIETRECDENLARRLFCPVAVHVAAAIGLVEREEMGDLSMYHFATRCFPECADGTSDKWLAVYRELFPNSDAVRSGRLDRSPEEVSSHYTCTFPRGRDRVFERYP